MEVAMNQPASRQIRTAIEVMRELQATLAFDGYLEDMDIDTARLQAEYVLNALLEVAPDPAPMEEES